MTKKRSLLIRKFILFFMMIFIASAPHYELTLYSTLRTEGEPYSMLFLWSVMSMMLLPILSSFICKSEKQQVIYFFINMTIMAFGEYFFKTMFLAFYDPAKGLASYYYIKGATRLMKVLLAVFTFFLCEYRADRYSVIYTLKKKFLSWFKASKLKQQQ